MKYVPSQERKGGEASCELVMGNSVSKTQICKHTPPRRFHKARPAPNQWKKGPMIILQLSILLWMASSRDHENKWEMPKYGEALNPGPPSGHQQNKRDEEREEEIVLRSISTTHAKPYVDELLASGCDILNVQEAKVTKAGKETRTPKWDDAGWNVEFPYLSPMAIFKEIGDKRKTMEWQPGAK